ncbi:MAG: DNA/pantothenate metabolism flavoprotein domain protein, partial [Verrucomicrobia bacterium]|nr:DNA/pantothenate metabolism flavoprotein domain protein [Verrucomicrobiota bacterium]
WKYEVDGDRSSAIAKARQQIRVNRIDACVANGPAYGSGFGLVTPEGPAVHLADRAGLLAALSRWLEKED